MRHCFVGADLGQTRDPSAIAIVERAELVGEWDAGRFAFRKKVARQLRFLERMPLGTPYPEVVDRVEEVTEAPGVVEQCHLVVDGTGVGPPVVDMIRERRLKCALMAAKITSGDRESMEDGYYKVPKRNLIVGLQVLLQRGGLQIAEGLPLGRELVAEMAAMEVRVTHSGHEQYGAWRVGKHDDMVLAVALACWGIQKTYPYALQGDDQWWRNPRQADVERVFRGVNKKKI